MGFSAQARWERAARLRSARGFFRAAL